MVKSLVIGGGGFVASHLIEYLLEKGETVSSTYRWNEDLSRAERYKDKIQMIPMDLIDLSACIRVMEEVKPDYLFHLAAQSYVTDSFVNPIATVMINVVGTTNLFESIRLTRQDPVIYIASSSEVYGDVPQEEIPIKETNQFRPANPYAASKVGVDALAYMYYKYFGLKVIRTRWFSHWGLGRTMMSAENSFAKQIALIEIGKQEPIVRVGNLKSVRTIADVRDAVRGIWLAVQKCQPGEVYNIGGSTVKTIGEVLEYLISLSPIKDRITVKEDPALLRKADVNLQIPDISRFVQATQWKPEIPYEKTLYDILQFWRGKVTG